MKGKILDFSVQSGEGVISGDDGTRYPFVGAEWKAPTPPDNGKRVDFDVSDGKAIGVYLDNPNTTGSKKVGAILFALFLGTFGAHKFYLGLTRPAVIMLCVSLFGILLLGIPTLIIAIIAFIELIIYITKSDEEFEQIYVIDRKEWF